MLDKFQEDRKAIEFLWSDGVSGQELLLKQTALVDQYIKACFEKVGGELGDEGVALVALGGYGRKELFPYSDVDLMLLYGPQQKKQVARVVDSVLYPLWDTGLDVGHGVRSVEESLAHAEEEYLFRVALLDARFLCGDRDLFSELEVSYRKQFIDGCRKSFVEEMKESRKERRDRFGTHSYLLEPHLKEGKGGMRDVQAMFWTVKVVFGLSSLDDIEGAGLLTSSERADFQKSIDMLRRLRMRLHYMSRRKNDQLYFEQQADMAVEFGYPLEGKVLPVEAFMRDLYCHLENIASATDLFFDHIDEALGLDDGGVDVQDRQIEKGIEVRRGKLHLTADLNMMKKKPHTIVRLFLAMARTGLPLHYRTRKMVPTLVGGITDRVRRSPRLSGPVLSILLEAKDVFGVLEVMLESGLLTACIPEFRHVESLAQHDMYHVYTVDRHSLQTVAELRSVCEEFPAVFADVLAPDVLYFAALLHDVAKGSGRDHSEAGAEVIRLVGERFGFSEESCGDLGFLVLYHLFIPENALRRDLNDVAFMQRCGRTVGTASRLAMLYLLSVADSRATGPSAWSDWKASLMDDMYLKVLAAIECAEKEVGDVSLQGHMDQGVEWLRGQLVEALDDDGVSFDQSVLPPDYLLSFDLTDVLGHVGLYQKHYRLLRQKSYMEACEVEGGWEILVMSYDRPGLLAKVCGVLALHSLVVMTAQIFTWQDGTVVDVVTVRPLDYLQFAEKNWLELREDVDKAIAHRLDVGRRLYQKWLKDGGRRYELAGNVESRVVVDNDSSDDYSVVEVYATDRPHLLYRITQALADFGVNIHRAYIATEVEQLIDVFYVLDARGEKLIESDFQSEVVESLERFLVVNQED